MIHLFPCRSGTNKEWLVYSGSELHPSNDAGGGEEGVTNGSHPGEVGQHDDESVGQLEDFFDAEEARAMAR